MSKMPMRPSRRAVIGALGATLLLPRALAAGTLEHLSGRAFGTTWSLAAAPGSGIDRLRPAIEGLLDEIDREMSPWREDSALSRFNAADAGAQDAGPELLRVAGGALEMAEVSNGAFDPTVGPLVARWGFGPIEGGAPDWRGLSIGAGRISKARADLTLDLCGIAKGRALDRAVELLRSAGVTEALFDLGGELCAIGRHPAGRSWQVAIAPQLPQRSAPPAVLRLEAGHAIATSGLENQSYALDGTTYGHIVDPATRGPAGGRLASVTVVARDAMAADAWATALFAAGVDAGPDLADAHDIPALFLTTDGAGAPIRTGRIGDMML